MNPADAADFGLADGGLARVASAHGSAVLRVGFDAGQARGTVFAPIHWNDEIAGDARVGAVVHPLTDPHSGQPDAKATSVTMSPVAGEPGGFILSRQASSAAWRGVLGVVCGGGRLCDAPRWTVRSRPGAGCIAVERAGQRCRAVPRRGRRCDPRRAVAGRPPGGGVLLGCRSARRLDGTDAALGGGKLSALDRLLILSGESGEGVPQTGPIVCACFGVGETAINEAITAGACDIDDIGRTLKAGTNCGSCLPELKKMLKARHAEHAS